MTRRDYRSERGIKLPSVTEIIGLLNKPALVPWGYKQGKWNFDRVTEQIIEVIKQPRPAEAGYEWWLVQLNKIEQIISEFPIRKLYDERDKAADAGTLAHAMIEVYLKNEGFVDIGNYAPEVVEKAVACFEAFKSWEKNHQFKVLESEKELISQIGFGGTIDVATVAGDPNIVDLKTSNGVYFSMKVQVAAYGFLWNENFPKQLIKGYRILRLGSEGDFSEHFWPNLDEELGVFMDLLDIQQRLKKTGQRL